MSSKQTTYHNFRAANGVKSPHLEPHEKVEKMKEFESNLCIKRLGNICIYLYIRAVRTGNLALYLSALEEFVKYFFTLDKLNYARMIPIYLAEMSQLEGTYSEIWSEFSNGNRV